MPGSSHIYTPGCLDPDRICAYLHIIATDFPKQQRRIPLTCGLDEFVESICALRRVFGTCKGICLGKAGWLAGWE
jgi:hypothetical protein